MDPERETGSWQSRVRFGPEGAFAYRPGEILVGAEVADLAYETLAGWVERRAAETDERIDLHRDEALVAGAFVRFTGSFETHEAVERLHGNGILAQVNHVLFATSCCPPHPADPCAGEYYASPFYANPFYANPFYANASPSPYSDPSVQLTGSRSSSARPAKAPALAKKTPVQGVRVAILDTGWADTGFAPQGLPAIKVTPHGGDQPDEDGDGFLDPAAGHGTFIGGVIEQATPGCDIEIIEILSTYGDGDEVTISNVLHALSQRPEKERPDIVNLSFGGYSPLGMGALAKAIADLADAGSAVVASAGNDSTCFPMFPASLPHVVGVAALDENDDAAVFTNYGPWVRACARGTNVVSLFFDNFNGAGPKEKNYDPDKFEGWALWSGTSFAAPAVVAALARAVAGGATPHQAVADLIDDENLERKPMLGTVVKLA